MRFVRVSSRRLYADQKGVSGRARPRISSKRLEQMGYARYRCCPRLRLSNSDNRASNIARSTHGCPCVFVLCFTTSTTQPFSLHPVALLLKFLFMCAFVLNSHAIPLANLLCTYMYWFKYRWWPPGASQVDVVVTAEERRRSSGVHVAVMAPQVTIPRTLLLLLLLLPAIRVTAPRRNDVYLRLDER